MKIRAISLARMGLIASAILLSPACSTTQATSGLHAKSCLPAPSSLDSPPGRKWLQSNEWRFPSRADAEQAYVRLAKDASPWPDWYVPYKAELKPGIRFQMAIGGTQTELNSGQLRDVRRHPQCQGRPHEARGSKRLEAGRRPGGHL